MKPQKGNRLGFSLLNKRDGWFAVCPICDNPIRIIGMLERENPYGKHYFPAQGDVSVPLNGTVDKEEYEWCPYASANKTLSKAMKRREDSPQATLIKQTLIEQFDRVIYLLEKNIGMKVSETLATQMLEDYRRAEGWRYKGASLQNIPWIFAYMIQAKNVYGRIFTDREFAEELCRKSPELAYSDTKKIIPSGGKKKLCDLTFSFIKHKRQVNEHILTESIEFNIANAEQKTVCKKTIVFDHSHFMRLIASTKNEAYRKPEWVELAQRVLIGT